MKLFKSFSTRLSMYVIVITAVLFVVSMLLIGERAKHIITEDAKQNATNMLDAKIGDIEKIISNVEAAVNNNVWLILEHLDNPDYMYKVTSELVIDNVNIMGSAVAFQPFYFEEKGRYFSPYSYYDKDSMLCSIQLGTDKYNYHNREWFNVPARTKKPHWSEPYYDEGGGSKMMTTYSVPVMNDKGDVLAILTADVALDNLASIINSTNLYDHNVVALLSSRGTFVASKDTSLIMKVNIREAGQMLAGKSQNFADRILSGKKGINEFYVENHRCFCVYGPVNNGWSAYILCLYDEVLEDLKSLNILLQLVVIISLILLYLLCWSAIKKITYPITEFSDFATKIKDGHLDAELPEVKSVDELKTLHDSLHDMQASVKQLESTTKLKERFESELNIARKIQLGMIPKNFPPYLSAIMSPAKEVGGDFYDFIERDGYLYFAVGDVTGKGVPAALFMSLTRSAFRFVSGLHLSMEQVVSQINESICDGNSTSMFVTLFAGKLNLSTGHLDYCNAGHNPIVIVPPSGEARYLEVYPNLAAGLFDDFEYKKQELDLEPGTRLLLYTDGVTEAENQDKELYGEQRLIEFANRTSSTIEIGCVSQELFNSVKNFAAGAEQNDDITIMTIDYGKKV